MAIRSFHHHTPILGKNVYIDEAALVLGDVKIGDDSSIWPMTVVRGDIHKIRIGCRTNIQDGSVLHVTHDSQYSPGGQPLIIGDDVTVGHKSILHACQIGNQCLIGMGAIILDGAIIEDRVMVGANALVSSGKKLESGYLYLGSPAKVVRKLTDEELNFLNYSAQSYVDLKNQHLLKEEISGEQH